MTAAESINFNLGVGDDETHKMKKARLAAEGPVREPNMPGFLQPCDGAQAKGKGKRAREEEEGPETAAWKPSWGIRRQDTLVGSTLNSVDWSKNSIPPADRSKIVVKTDIEEAETLGAQGIAVV